MLSRFTGFLVCVRISVIRRHLPCEGLFLDAGNSHAALLSTVQLHAYNESREAMECVHLYRHQMETGKGLTHISMIMFDSRFAKWDQERKWSVFRNADRIAFGRRGEAFVAAFQ